MKRFFVALLAPVVVLVGAGCLGAADTETPTVKKSGTVAQKDGSTTTANTAPSNGTTTTKNGDATAPAGAVEPDATWLTYTAKSGRYSFKYPVRGKYAPAWGASIVSASDAKVKDGCWQLDVPDQETRKITVNGVETCMSSGREGAAGSVYLSHTWLIPSKTGFEKVSFTKKYVNIGEAPGCADKAAEWCRFDVSTYDATLDAVVRSYQAGE